MSAIKRLLFFTSLLCLISIRSRAATADQIRVGLYAPRTFFRGAIRNLISQVSNNRNMSVPDQVWSVDQITWHVQGITLNSTAAISHDVLTASTYEIAANPVGVQMNVSKIWVDQVIRKVISGVVFNIHLNATCGPISLVQSDAQADLKINYQILPTAVRADISSLQLGWNPSSWKIAPISCQGPQGFSTTLTQALQQQLSSPVAAEAFVKQMVASAINQKLDAINGKIGAAIPIEIPQNPLPLTMSVSQLQSLKAGVLITSAISWSDPGNGYRGPQLPVSNIDFSKFDSPTVITQKQDWPYLIQAEMSMFPSLGSLNLNKFTAFEGLLSSGFEEFFIWPDLMNYGKTAPFSLVLSRLNLDSFKWKKNADFQATVDGIGWIRAFRDNQFWQYVDFNGHAELHCTPQIKAGFLTMKVGIDDGVLHHQFGATYVKHYNDVNTFISDINMTDSLENWGNPYHEDIPLFSLDLGAFGKAQFSGLQVTQPNLITMPLGISSP